MDEDFRMGKAFSHCLVVFSVQERETIRYRHNGLHHDNLMQFAIIVPHSFMIGATGEE